MFIVRFERLFAPRISALIVGGLMLASAWQSGSRAASLDASRGMYVISDHEGYGIVECLTQKRECGKIVADSWCESHGRGPALAFGRADEITASIGPAASGPTIDAEAAIVACRD
ncbi:MAG: hypothetical protein C3F11_19300 [Methylocystaceae bacterium]|nr:MAG: hypothetical protein C3F11_19300 [Methylocystaceae bacterium]